MSLPGAVPYPSVCVLVAVGTLGLAVGSLHGAWAARIARHEPGPWDRRHLAASHLHRSQASRPSPRLVRDNLPAGIICALAYLTIVWAYGLTLEALELLLLASALLLASLVDLASLTIPNGVVLFAILVRLAYLLAAGGLGLLDGGPSGAAVQTMRALGASMLSGLGVYLVLLLVTILADRAFGRSSMGGGDLKLFFLAGLYLGWRQALLLIALACLMGMVFALVTLPRDRHARHSSAEGGRPGLMGRAFPFGPSIALAFWATILWGRPLMAWYLGQSF